MDSIQAQLLSDSGAGPAEGEEMPMGPPPHHNTDHKALVLKTRGEPGGVKPYIIERLNIPDSKKTPPTAEQTEGEQMFETLKSKVPKPEQR
jgi:hypothetical protein